MLRAALRPAGPGAVTGAITGALAILRPGTLLATGVLTAVGHATADPPDLDDLSQVALVTMAAVAAANVHNDVVDLSGDRINRPGRALPSGRLPIGAARVMVGALATVTIVAALALGVRLAVWAVASLAVGLAYSDRLQRAPLLGNLVVAGLFANALLYGAAASGGVTAVSVVASTEVLWFIVGREVLKGVPDVAGDRVLGKATVASRWGTTRAVQLFSVCALLPTVTAALAVVAGWACVLHLLAMAGAVSVPAVLIGHTVSKGDAARERIMHLVDRSALIWASGSAGLLLLVWC